MRNHNLGTCKAVLGVYAAHNRPPIPAFVAGLSASELRACSDPEALGRAAKRRLGRSTTAARNLFLVHFLAAIEAQRFNQTLTADRAAQPSKG